MNIHSVFAIIKNSTVANIIVGDFYSCSLVARANYGDDAVVVDVTQIPTQQGDKYEDKTFYRFNEALQDYQIIEPLPTDTDRIDYLTSKQNKESKEISNNKSAITELELAIVDIYESL